MTEELITGTSGVVRKRSKMEADEWEYRVGVVIGWLGGEWEVMKSWKIVEWGLDESSIFILKSPQTNMYFLFNIMVSKIKHRSWMDCDGALGGR